VFSLLTKYFALPIQAFILVGLLVPNSWSVETEPSAEKILSQLTTAMRTQNYRGVFTYEHGGSLETLELAHAVVDGVEHERYILLNGPEQKLLKDGRRASCESLAGRMVRGATLATSQGNASHFNDYYHLFFKGYDRVAGRRVAVVQLLPKDNQRFGMRLGVDVESGVLLQALIMLPNKVLERMQFVAFDYNPKWQAGELEALSGVSAAELDCGEPETTQNQSDHRVKDTQVWLPAWLPGGFTLSNSRWTEQDGLVHTYTDGLASFSVFVNPDLVPESKGSRIPRGIAQRGAILVVMELRRVGEHFLHITLVGEVPQASAVRVMQSIGVPPVPSQSSG